MTTCYKTSVLQQEWSSCNGSDDALMLVPCIYKMLRNGEHYAANTLKSPSFKEELLVILFTWLVDQNNSRLHLVSPRYQHWVYIHHDDVHSMRTEGGKFLPPTRSKNRLLFWTTYFRLKSRKNKSKGSRKWSLHPLLILRCCLDFLET